MKSFWKIILFLYLSGLPLLAFDHSHKIYDSILKKYVSVGRVDYKAINKEPSLKIYLDSLSSVSEVEYNSFTKEQKLSFLINAYNAFTIQLILDHYPIKSIRKIGILPLAPWKKEFFKLLGEKRSLGWIEHEKLRKDFEEPRIHFAIVCASIGCPILINEAYIPEKLESQLKLVQTQFLNDSSKNRYDTQFNILYISPIFDWFKEDFTKKSSLIAYLQPFFKDKIATNAKIEYTEYDWNLNEK
ncbi:MAG TPA: DUF547 domain-containing protein [Leptospiraceae bacterium]|nr:DUF547 domain-containing protein [Leptospiraceae bacterium]HMW06874.1 DUF547 domain-containing protein [Leptospiraceae bacterium]HMX34568.1 DUF547 domain-containing protein [Leptospiraceae bacterium]HMY32393.1 DUF547 domain-containing protein [Leptospiraceae bacterium]HMZ65311.1 DUF547 domain-containing protein [Leptospiraceae bacterium]